MFIIANIIKGKGKWVEGFFWGGSLVFIALIFNRIFFQVDLLFFEFRYA